MKNMSMNEGYKIEKIYDVKLYSSNYLVLI